MRKNIIGTALCILLAVSASAQNTAYKGKMNVTPVRLEQVGDSLYISVDFDIRGVNVGSHHSISLVPVLVAPGVERNLPDVQVKGRGDYLCSKRRLALMSKDEKQQYEQNAPYIIIKGYKKSEAKQIQYNKVIPFEPWMKEARLDIREDVCGCGNPSRSLAVSQLVNQVQLEKVLAPYNVAPSLTYVKPEVEAVKKREMVGEAFLDFVVSKTDILPDYLNNPRELKKITDMMDEVQNDSAISVRGISVIGYASPEGTLKFNQYLSEGRAGALVDYLTPRFNFPKEMYHVEFGGENWDGLLAAVEASDMQYRDEVIHIIKTVPAEINLKTNTSRKRSLMSLRSGNPYRFMLKNYFPYLRKAICKIDYEVAGFDVAKAKEVFKKRPQNLSLNEMYLVANTYKPGTREFTDVFETAVRMFPDDDIANLNAAVASLERNDLISAQRYLSNVKTPTTEYNNAKGVLLLLQEDYAKAEEYFALASVNKLEAANHNLEEMRKKLENIKQLNKEK